MADTANLQRLLRSRLQHAGRGLLRAPSSSAPPTDWPHLDWPSYLKQRGWVNSAEYEEAAPFEQDAAVRFLSSLLTYPVTLARSW